MSIRLAFTNLPALQARCSVTTVALGTDDPAYDADALLSRNEWEPLAPALAADLRATADTPSSALVEFVRIPPDANRESVHHFQPAGDQHPSKFLSHVDCAPDQCTTTTDTQAMRKLGLHLDNFDQMPIARRAQSRRRIGANLGPGARFMVLATCDIQDIA